MIIEKFVLSKTAPRNKYVGWIDTSGDEPKIKFNVGGKWSEEYDPEQVQVDWNCVDTTSKAFIKNKPTIPEAQIQSDWSQSNTSAKDFIKNKPVVAPEPVIIQGVIYPNYKDDPALHEFRPHNQQVIDATKIVNALQNGGQVAFGMTTQYQATNPTFGEIIVCTSNYIAWSDGQPTSITLRGYSYAEGTHTLYPVMLDITVNS